MTIRSTGCVFPTARRRARRFRQREEMNRLSAEKVTGRRARLLRGVAWLVW